MLRHRPPAYDTWAEPRRLAWDALDTCADGYYRSFLPPGEKAGPVEWSAKEVHNLERLGEEHMYIIILKNNPSLCSEY